MDRVADGAALTAVAKESHISREALRRYIGERAEFRRVDGRFRILGDRRRSSFPLYTAGTVRQVSVDRENARLLGRYMAAAGRFLHSNRDAHLESFKGGSVIDGSGHRHPFETDPETLYALDARDEVSFQRYNTDQEGDSDD